MFGLSQELLALVTDTRDGPTIPTRVFLQAGLVIFWLRLGSLNALEQTADAKFWKRWLGRALPSVDQLGKVYTKLDRDSTRAAMHTLYAKLKRNKALPGIRGLQVAILDGHETSSSYKRCCPGCLQRTIRTKDGDKIQYYHRNVTLMLIGEREQYRLLLDMEPQRRGEDEVATALRLLARVCRVYPRAFQVVLADGLYCRADFLNYLTAHRKYAVIVLKDERRDLYQDALGVFNSQQGQPGQYRAKQCWWWDEEGFTSWKGLAGPVRVVRSVERTTIKRQLDDKEEQVESQWLWVTTLPKTLASTRLVVQLGHARWDLENYGFNELVNHFQADHVYKHDPIAIETFCLVSFLAINLLLAFFLFNVKAQLRNTRSSLCWARILSADLYSQLHGQAASRAP